MVALYVVLEKENACGDGDKMTFEPLKDKKVDILPTRKLVYNNYYGFLFYTNDVKQAIKGLKKEIKSFKKHNPSFDKWIYSEIMTLIHKWFKDVIK